MHVCILLSELACYSFSAGAGTGEAAETMGLFYYFCFTWNVSFRTAV